MKLTLGEKRRRRPSGRAGPGNAVRVNVPEEVRRAWRWIWARALESRLAGRDFHGSTYYFTATDVERRLRARGQEILDGLPEGELGEGLLPFSRLRFRGLNGRPLLDHVRRALREEVLAGVLEMEGSRGGTCLSGARFRPAGAEFSPQEKRRAEVEAATPPEEKRRKAWIRHLAEKEEKDGRTRRVAACLAGRKTRRGYSFRRREPSLTEDPEAVTCKRCQALLEKRKVEG